MAEQSQASQQPGAGQQPGEGDQQQGPSADEQLRAAQAALYSGVAPMQERFQDTMDAIIAAYARAKIQKLEILNHNGANLAYVSKMAAANAMGLDEKQRLGVAPFPHSSTEINIGESDSEKRLKSEVDDLRGRLDRMKQEADDARRQAAEADRRRQQDRVQPAPAPQQSSDWKKWIWPLVAAGGLGIGGGSLGTYLFSGSGSGAGEVGIEVEGWQTNSPEEAK